jgi:hypothetical protein
MSVTGRILIDTKIKTSTMKILNSFLTKVRRPLASQCRDAGKDLSENDG